MVVQACKYSPNSRCRPSSCLLPVFAMFLANSSPTSNEWNVPPLCSHYQNNSTLSPGLLGWRLNYLAILLHDWRRFSHIAKCFQIWSTIVGSVMNYAWDFSPLPSLLNNTMKCCATVQATCKKQKAINFWCLTKSTTGSRLILFEMFLIWRQGLNNFVAGRSWTFYARQFAWG